MTVRVYRSSDANAPALRGNTPGDLINLLDKCLVTGYGTKAAAGWTKPFTGTNVAAFRQGAGSNGMYLRVDDTSTVTGNRKATVRAYETMSDVNTGLPQSFPTEAQEPGGATWWTKQSSSTAANPRAWIVWADERMFYIYINTYPEQTASPEYYNGWYAFGDINSYKPGDGTATLLIGDQARTTIYSSQPTFNQSSQLSAVGNDAIWMARRFDQIGAPIRVGWHSDYVKQGSTFSGAVSYPHGPDGALLMAPVWCHDPTISPYNIRGVFPGIYAHCHNSASFGHLDTIEGQGVFAGRTFTYIRTGSNGGILMDNSDNWR